jgi:hypothetical protein
MFAAALRLHRLLFYNATLFLYFFSFPLPLLFFFILARELQQQKGLYKRAAVNDVAINSFIKRYILFMYRE